MSKILFYSHTKEDLKYVVRSIIDEIRKAELIESSIPYNDEKLDQKTTASLLGVTVTTLISWRKKGKIPRDSYIRVGKPIFYSKKRILAFAKSNRDIIKPLKD